MRFRRRLDCCFVCCTHAQAHTHMCICQYAHMHVYTYTYKPYTDAHPRLAMHASCVRGYTHSCAHTCECACKRTSVATGRYRSIYAAWHSFAAASSPPVLAGHACINSSSAQPAAVVSAATAGYGSGDDVYECATSLVKVCCPFCCLVDPALWLFAPTTFQAQMSKHFSPSKSVFPK